MKKMELRTSNAKFETNEDGSLVVSGYVNKTEQLSEILGATKRFKEKIAKGAFSRAIRTQKEIDFLAEHDSKRILSSTRNGSLKLTEDSEGLYMEATITPTSWGKDAYELIKAGLYKNMSFGFRTIKDSWKKISSDLYERTIEDLELFEVSVVKNPAYSQSTIAARSIEIIDQPEIHVEEEKEERNIHKEILQQIKTVDVAERMLKLDSENSAYRNLVDKEKKKLEELRAEKEKMEEDTMNEETRVLQKAEDGIPSTGIGEIAKGLEHESNVYALARKIPFEGDSMKIPQETAFGDAEFVGEGKNVRDVDIPTASFVEMKKKRLGVSMNMSKKLMYDSGVNLKEYCKEVMTRRTAKALEKSILAGQYEEEFKGIAFDENVSASNISLALKVEQLRKLTMNVNASVLKNSAFYMSKAFFDKVAELKDDAGQYVVRNVVIDGKIVPTLFGFPIEVTDALEDGSAIGQVPVIFGSIADSYTIGIKKPFEINTVQNDTTHVLRGSVLFAGDMFADGAVTNYDAICKGIIA
ncbi:phage major capsid protein [Lederbergia citri]|uniref:Phage major capsid protein n=1 Tax=Lederbergia citri TaxID=2833580 RepID=A0A942TAW5_9BACI|nr:phage major capsid protein [Lederbergia citri]MBS4194355.1 phage major capsid protein [Lederbergia citri]